MLKISQNDQYRNEQAQNFWSSCAGKLGIMHFGVKSGHKTQKRNATLPCRFVVPALLTDNKAGSNLTYTFQPWLWIHLLPLSSPGSDDHLTVRTCILCRQL